MTTTPNAPTQTTRPAHRSGPDCYREALLCLAFAEDASRSFNARRDRVPDTETGETWDDLHADEDRAQREHVAWATEAQAWATLAHAAAVADQTAVQRAAAEVLPHVGYGNAWRAVTAPAAAPDDTWHGDEDDDAPEDPEGAEETVTARDAARGIGPRVAAGDPDVRPAEPGELCGCGRQAVSVVRSLLTGEWGGVCMLDNGGVPPDGLCPFCNNELEHDAERANDAGDVVGVFRQGGKCPRYRLRLDDPVPGAPS